MGYGKFDGNEMDVMESFLRHGSIQKPEILENYPHQIKSLLNRKMIVSVGKKYVITKRGESAITQALRDDGHYWVASLKPWVPPWERKVKILVPAGYMKR